METLKTMSRQEIARELAITKRGKTKLFASWGLRRAEMALKLLGKKKNALIFYYKHVHASNAKPESFQNVIEMKTFELL
jgi:hypothetical protein